MEFRCDDFCRMLNSKKRRKKDKLRFFSKLSVTTVIISSILGCIGCVLYITNVFQQFEFVQKFCIEVQQFMVNFNNLNAFLKPFRFHKHQCHSFHLFSIKIYLTKKRTISDNNSNWKTFHNKNIENWPKLISLSFLHSIFCFLQLLHMCDNSNSPRTSNRIIQFDKFLSWHVCHVYRIFDQLDANYRQVLFTHEITTAIDFRLGSSYIDKQELLIG